MNESVLILHEKECRQSSPTYLLIKYYVTYLKSKN